MTVCTRRGSRGPVTSIGGRGPVGLGRSPFCPLLGEELLLLKYPFCRYLRSESMRISNSCVLFLIRARSVVLVISRPQQTGSLGDSSSIPDCFWKSGGCLWRQLGASAELTLHSYHGMFQLYSNSLEKFCTYYRSQQEYSVFS